MHHARSEDKEAAREQFSGLWAAMTTPFTPDGHLVNAVGAGVPSCAPPRDARA
jgi:hypothetical protein